MRTFTEEELNKILNRELKLPILMTELKTGNVLESLELSSLTNMDELGIPTVINLSKRSAESPDKVIKLEYRLVNRSEVNDKL